MAVPLKLFWWLRVRLTTALELRALGRQQRIERFHSGLPDHQSLHGALARKARQLQALVRPLERPNKSCALARCRHIVRDLE